MGRRAILEPHYDFKAAAQVSCLSVSKLRQLVREKKIDPVVEIPGRKKAVARILIPASSLARCLSQYLVTRNPELVSR